MEDNNQKYLAEFVGTRLDKSNFRMFIALMVMIAIFIVNNLAWLYAWVQYDYSSTETTYTQDGQGTNIIGNSNEVQHYVPGIESEDENSEKEEKE